MTVAQSRVRLFVLDAETGIPRPGVPVGVAAEGAWEDDSGETFGRLVLGTYASDAAGYVSAPVPVPVGTSRVAAYPLADPDVSIDLGPWLAGPLTPKDDLGPTVAPLLVPRDLPREREVHLPSIVDPNVDDWRLSPGSFAYGAPILTGEGGCEELLPSTAAERTFRFQQLVREPAETPGELKPAKLAECEESERKTPPLCWRSGALLEYEMTWIPVGHALGEVVYSLPLAPCETVNLAIVDWSRSDDVVRGEDVDVAEQLRHSLRRERAVEETVQGMLHERQRGRSFMAGHAGAGGMSFGQGSFSGTLAIGTASASTEGRRRLAADAVQQLADGVVQSGAAQRRLSSTVVVQATQAERDAVETRSVANHNHCHALTVLYYEVLRHYRVQTRLAASRDVIFVRRPLVDLANRRVARRHGEVLRAALLDPTLDHCFEALEKERCAELALERGAALEEPADHELGKIEAGIRTGSQGIPHDSTSFLAGVRPQYQAAEISLLTGSGDVPLRVDDELGWIDGSGHVWHPAPTEIAMRAIPGDERTQVLQAGQQDILTLRPGRRVSWSEVRGLRVSFSAHPPTDAAWHIAQLSLRTTSGADHWTLCDDASDHALAPGESFDLAVGPYGPREPADALTEVERCCVENLLEHFSDNRHHYSRAIWLAEDPDRRASWLDAYAFAAGAERGRLLDFVENRLVGVAGEYIALPTMTDELAKTIDGASPAERIVSLPVRGVFAEAKLGRCNACEERDPTRYWDWSESPCPPPPQIAPVSLGTRARDVVPAAPSPPAPALGIEAPPAAPAPGEFIGEVLELLGTSDVFRDMSAREQLAEMMGKLIDGAVAMELARQRGAGGGAGAGAGGLRDTGAEAAAGEPASGEGTGRRADGAAERPRQSPATTAAEMGMVLDQWQDKGLISPEDARAAALPWTQYGLTPAQHAPAARSVEVPRSWLLSLPGAPTLTPFTAWAAGVTLLISWRDGLENVTGRPYRVDEVMALLDAARGAGATFYRDEWASGRGIVHPVPTTPDDELPALLSATATRPGAVPLDVIRRLTANEARSFGLNELIDEMERSGPLWFTITGGPLTVSGVSVENFFGIEGFVTISASGDGSAFGSQLEVIRLGHPLAQASHSLISLQQARATLESMANSASGAPPVVEVYGFGGFVARIGRAPGAVM